MLRVHRFQEFPKKTIFIHIFAIAENDHLRTANTPIINPQKLSLNWRKAFIYLDDMPSK